LLPTLCNVSTAEIERSSRSVLVEKPIVTVLCVDFARLFSLSSPAPVPRKQQWIPNNSNGDNPASRRRKTVRAILGTARAPAIPATTSRKGKRRYAALSARGKAPAIVHLSRSVQLVRSPLVDQSRARYHIEGRLPVDGNEEKKQLQNSFPSSRGLPTAGDDNPALSRCQRSVLHRRQGREKRGRRFRQLNPPKLIAGPPPQLYLYRRCKPSFSLSYRRQPVSLTSPTVRRRRQGRESPDDEDGFDTELHHGKSGRRVTARRRRSTRPCGLWRSGWRCSRSERVRFQRSSLPLEKNAKKRPCDCPLFD
jgi:hypothetical protein